MPVLQRFEGEKEWKDEVPATAFSNDDLKAAFRTMLLVRTLDVKLTNMQRQGRIGFYGACTGQEATPIGTAMVLKPEDWIFPALREGSAALHRGYKLSRYVAQCIGNNHDVHKGRQMPCHYSDRDVNHVSWSSVIAVQLVHAAGAAYAAKVKGDDIVTVGFMGDGATSENDFHSALNLAAVTKSPCVFICQNNHFAISVLPEKQSVSENYAIKATAYGMPGIKVDGNDILAVAAAVKDAVDRARAGDGPTLIEAETYRLTPHSSSDDPSRYRDEAEYQEWLKRDPVDIFRAHLKDAKLWTKKWEAEVQAAIDKEVDEAIKTAEADDLPPTESMFEDVYEDMPELLKDQAKMLQWELDNDVYDWPPQH